MCECAIHTPETHDWFGEKKYRLATFFDSWWDEYCRHPKHFIQSEQYKAVQDIRTCRTAARGVDIYACPECGETTEVYHSCKNRFCPTCSWNDTVRWAAKVKCNMLNIPHRHVVFTIPHQFNFLIIRNKFLLLNTLMQTSAEALKDWISYKFDLQPGIISVLHTFGEQKDNHFHTHMILSWGGVDKNRTVQQIKGKYVKYDYLKSKFRGIFEKRLVDFFDSGKLDHDFRDVIEFKRFIKRVNNKNWIIHLEDPMETPADVIRYIGRYSKRACLSEYKITFIEGEFIGFRHKDYKNKDYFGHPIEKEKVLNYRDFFPLLLQHVPLPRFRLVRYYGIYSNRGHLSKELFCSAGEDVKVNWRDVQQSETGQDPLICKKCNVIKTYSHSFAESKSGNYIYYRLGLNPDPHATFFQKVA
jgi:hypothetical protein